MLEMMLLGQKIYIIPWKAQEASDEWISQFHHDLNYTLNIIPFVY